MKDELSSQTDGNFAGVQPSPAAAASIGNASFNTQAYGSEAITGQPLPLSRILRLVPIIDFVVKKLLSVPKTDSKPTQNRPQNLSKMPVNRVEPTKTNLKKFPKRPPPDAPSSDATMQPFNAHRLTMANFG